VLALTATLSLSMSTLRAELVVWDPVEGTSAVGGKGVSRGAGDGGGFSEGGGDVHMRGKGSRRLSTMVSEQDDTETEKNGEEGRGHSFRGAGGLEFQAAYAKLGQMRQVRFLFYWIGFRVWGLAMTDELGQQIRRERFILLNDRVDWSVDCCGVPVTNRV
jgi:hypothetical protein